MCIFPGCYRNPRAPNMLLINDLLSSHNRSGNELSQGPYCKQYRSSWTRANFILLFPIYVTAESKWKQWRILVWHNKIIQILTIWSKLRLVWGCTNHHHWNFVYVKSSHLISFWNFQKGSLHLSNRLNQETFLDSALVILCWQSNSRKYFGHGGKPWLQRTTGTGHSCRCAIKPAQWN